MADEQDLLLREIDEELKQDNLQRIWNSYGMLIVGGAVALVVGVAAFKGWQAYDLKQRTATAAQFSVAQELASGGKPDAAKEAFSKIAADAGAGYGMLARFQMAALSANNGDAAAAAGAYELIANDDKLESVYRDLAVVLGALSELNSKSGATALMARAEKLATGNGPWRYTAKEVSALSALKNGDNKTAHTRYDALTKDAAAPQGLRNRAREMLNVLSGK